MVVRVILEEEIEKLLEENNTGDGEDFVLPEGKKLKTTDRRKKIRMNERKFFTIRLIN